MDRLNRLKNACGKRVGGRGENLAKNGAIDTARHVVIVNLVLVQSRNSRRHLHRCRRESKSEEGRIFYCITVQ